MNPALFNNNIKHYAVNQEKIIAFIPHQENFCLHQVETAKFFKVRISLFLVNIEYCNHELL